MTGNFSSLMSKIAYKMCKIDACIKLLFSFHAVCPMNVEFTVSIGHII